MKFFFQLFVIFSFILNLHISGLWSEEISFDHDYRPMEHLFEVHVKDGKVNYSELKLSPESLDEIIRTLEAVTPKEYNVWSNTQKMAFWINSYNIGAIKLIVDHYPIEKSFSIKALVFPVNSIQRIPNAWNKKILTLLNKKISLNHIEHKVLRKEFQDPRIHFSIVCASIGCPVLRGEPYVYHHLDDQMDDQVRVFLADPSKYQGKKDQKKIGLSPILKWFKADFKEAGGVIAFIRSYLPDENKDSMPDSVRIRWLKYDWSLNEY